MLWLIGTGSYAMQHMLSQKREVAASQSLVMVCKAQTETHRT